MTTVSESVFLVNQAQLAAVLSLTTRQIRNLQDEGMPSRAVGNQRQYDLRQVVPWYVARKQEEAKPERKSEADARKALAEARLKELDLAEREGELVPLAVHRRVMGEVFDDVRSNLLNLPGKVAPQLTGLTSPREAVAILRPAVDQCLVSLVELAADLEDEADREEAGGLPEDLPGLRWLVQEGVTSVAELRRRRDDLEEITHIGPVTAAALRDWLDGAGEDRPA